MNYDRAQGIVSGGFACFILGELILKKKLVKNEPELILIMNPIGNRYQIDTRKIVLLPSVLYHYVEVMTLETTPCYALEFF